ncbi:hypothetical protein IWQ48_000528 [Labrenzia sp. EL_13]|nr:hypothetical protein [Labrenzia sp. EL_13]
MNRIAFEMEIRPLWNHYRKDNKWVGKWDPSWNEDKVMEDFVAAAYNLYEATSRNALKLVLLGGTGIRLNKELIANFGVTGANGIQDQATEVHVTAEQQLRTEGTKRPVPSVPVVEVGSILSEKNWTPLLNDALIVGAATAGQQFQIALENGYHHLWRDCEEFVQWKADPAVRGELEKLQRMNCALDLLNRHIRHNPRLKKGSATQCARDKLSKDHALQSTIFFNMRGAEFYKKVWQQFFYENLGMLWDNKGRVPRVLARELIGLSLFGYKPEFKNMTLGFVKSKRAPQPKFAEYVKLLRELGMERNNRAGVMKYLSGYLFGDESAVCFPEDKNFSKLKNRYLQNVALL